jgi:hypothetical protein
MMQESDPVDMSDKLVIYNAPVSSQQLSLRKTDSETEEMEREQRIQDVKLLPSVFAHNACFTTLPV